MEEVVFRFKRLFYLNNHFGTIEQSFLVRYNLSSDCLIISICKTAADAGAFLNQNRVACAAHCLNTCGGHTDAEFIIFDFLCNANNHVFSSYYR